MQNKLRTGMSTLIGGSNGDRVYAELFFRMQRVADPTIKSMGVTIRGGKPTLIYNPALVERWHISDLVGVLKHEVCHLLLKHVGRIGDTKNHRLGNIAADIVVNQLVSGFPRKLEFMRDDGSFEVCDTVYLEKMQEQVPELLPNKHFEWYLEALSKHVEDLQGETADEHLEADSGMSAESQNRIWRELLGEAAEAAKRAGDAPRGQLREILSEFMDTSVDWKTAMRQFPQEAERFAKVATRKRRNTRFGVLQPGSRADRRCRVAVGFDLSGSITDDIKDAFTRQLVDLSQHAEVTVLFFDTTVTAEKVFEEETFTWNVPGGGGTLFAPVFERCEELQVDGLIMLTDGENADHVVDPGYPVLWGILDGYPMNQSFGQHVVVR